MEELIPLNLVETPVGREFTNCTALGRAKWWLVIDKANQEGVVDLCQKDLGHDVDLYVVCDLRTMTAMWMGLMTVAEARDSGKLRMTGERQLQASMQRWLGLSAFAGEPKRVRA